MILSGQEIQKLLPWSQCNINKYPLENESDNYHYRGYKDVIIWLVNCNSWMGHGRTPRLVL